MGGTITAYLAIRRPKFYKGLVFVVPAFRTLIKRQGLTYYMLRIIARFRPHKQFPKANLPFTRFPEANEIYENDPHVIHGNLEYASLVSLLGAIRSLEPKLK